MKQILLFLLAAATLMAADATGTWTGTMTPGGRDPGPARLVLKQEGATLTGTAGPNESEQYPITNGKVEGNAVTFDVPNNETVMKFVLKLEGDEIKGEISRERDGEKQTATLAVKRQK